MLNTKASIVLAEVTFSSVASFAPYKQRQVKLHLLQMRMLSNLLAPANKPHLLTHLKPPATRKLCFPIGSRTALAKTMKKAHAQTDCTENLKSTRNNAQIHPIQPEIDPKTNSTTKYCRIPFVVEMLAYAGSKMLRARRKQAHANCKYKFQYAANIVQIRDFSCKKGSKYRFWSLVSNVLSCFSSVKNMGEPFFPSSQKLSLVSTLGVLTMWCIAMW